jgi:hypothetical protein
VPRAGATGKEPGQEPVPPTGSQGKKAGQEESQVPKNPGNKKADASHYWRRRFTPTVGSVADQARLRC